VNVLRTGTAIEQCLRDFGQVGGRIDSLRRCSSDTVEIRSQTDVIDARDLRNI